MSEITETLLQENEPPKPAALVLKDVLLQKDDEDYQGKEPSKGGGQEKGKGEESKQKKEPPYSVCNEIKFFFNRGIPLGLASLLEWGIPPWFTMIMAGRTRDSANLQTALGYGRVFFNITMLMMIGGLCSYFTNVMPGCIGAERHDRIPMYFWRSISLVLLCTSPFYILQFFSAPILAHLGVDAHMNLNTTSWNASVHGGNTPLISDEVGVYTRLMIVTAVLLVFEIHLESVFINLGYVKSVAVNSLVTGMGLDIACTYLFIYHLRLGMFGAALVQMSVRGARCLMWCFYATIYGQWGAFCNCRPKGKKAERFLTMKELRVFLKLSVPAIISCFGGWFIFELQIMALAHIKDIGQAAVAAGAIWVQSETVVAAIQSGWITATKVRVINLMGMQDKGATKAFVILCLFSAGLVLLTNVPLVAASQYIAKCVSNDASVQQWFGKVVWLLALHSQTRVTSINMSSLFIAFNKPILANVITYGSFYLLSVPLTVFVSLTDIVTEDTLTKFAMCLGTSVLAQGYIVIIAGIFLCRFDWVKISGEIAARANTDKNTPRADKSPTGDDSLPSPVPCSREGDKV